MQPGFEVRCQRWVLNLEKTVPRIDGIKGVTFVNFSFNPMTRLPYVEDGHIPTKQLPKGMVMRIDPTVSTKTPINMIISKFYASGSTKLGFDLRGGQLNFKQMEQEPEMVEAAAPA